MQKEKSDIPELDLLKKEIIALNERLTLVESQLQISNIEKVLPVKETEENPDEFEIHLPFESQGSFEFRVGENGMAWLGNIVLLFGITFLIQYIHKNGNSLLSVLVGIVAVSGIYLGSNFLKNTNSYLAKLLTYNAKLMLFYLVIRLHYVSENPLIHNQILTLTIIAIVLGTLLFYAIKDKSQFKTGFILTLIVIAGIISNVDHFLLGTTVASAFFSVWLYHRFGWLKLTILFILITYFVQMMWLLNNPIITAEPGLRETNSFGYIYLILTGLLFSILALIPKKFNYSNEIILVSIILNGIGFTSLLLLTTITYFRTNYIFLFAGITIFCLAYCLILQSKSSIKISASFYAIYGFISMSIVIFGIYNFPKAFLLLSLQSFLVVSMALLFRSRFLIVMNTLLFLLLMAFYIKNPTNFILTDFTFVLVAFITARVLNWKKQRLTLQTELIRNLYLIAGFTMTLIALYNAVPEQYITISWIAAALLLFLFSYIIKNTKYRWLAIAFIIASTIHLVLIDMSKMNLIYRILVFLLMAVISIAISIVYTRYFVKKKNPDE